MGMPKEIIEWRGGIWNSRLVPTLQSTCSRARQQRVVVTRHPENPPDRLHYFTSGEAGGNELFQISLANCHRPSGCGFQTCI